MSADMEVDIFAEHAYGKIALKKLGTVAENFRLYRAGWLGEKPEEFSVMKVEGAEFRAAKSGPNKGKLSMMVPGSQRAVLVTKAEMAAAT